MSERRVQADEFAQLTEDTERLAKHVEDLRHRIVTNAKRRPSSATIPAQNGSAPAEAPQSGPVERAERTPHITPFPERVSCLASVSRWLPPLRPAQNQSDSNPRAKIGDAGRYSIVTPRRTPSSAPPPSAEPTETEPVPRGWVQR